MFYSSDKTWVLDQSERAQGPIYIIISRYLTNKEASTVLCSVVKHAGSGR